jgi:hypothetical protein
MSSVNKKYASLMDVVNMGKIRGAKGSKERSKPTNREGNITISAETHNRSMNQLSSRSQSTKSIRSTRSTRSTRHIINCQEIDSKLSSK